MTHAMTDEGHDRMQQVGRLMRRAALASVSVSLFLVAIKTFAYFASHSVAMLASLGDSALDLFTSGLNMIAIRSALTPADAEHRFGHGKAERMASMLSPEVNRSRAESASEASIATEWEAK